MPSIRLHRGVSGERDFILVLNVRLLVRCTVLGNEILLNCVGCEIGVQAVSHGDISPDLGGSVWVLPEGWGGMVLFIL